MNGATLVEQRLAALDFDKPRDGNAHHVLATGGTGFIGRLLVRALLADGWRVTLLTRNVKRANAMFSEQVQCVAQLDEIPSSERFDTIINLAGARILGWRWTLARQAALRKSRIGLTQDLVQWITRAQHKPRLLVSASAIGYYGVQARGDDAALTESSPPQNIFMSQLCQDWEAAAQNASNCGVRVVRLRFGLVLGRQGALPMMLLPIRLGMGGPLGDGRQWVSWIHVHDLLRIIGHVMQQGQLQGLGEASGLQAAEAVFNCTAPNAVTQKEFAQTAGRVLSRPSILPTPAWLVRWMLGEQADLLVEGQRVRPTRLLASGFQFLYPDLECALRDLAAG